MDYAFAPGQNDAYNDTMREMLRRRNFPDEALKTTLIDKPKTIKRVAEFFADLRSTVTTTPIGDLIIASHANDEGWLFIELDAKGSLRRPPGKDPKVNYDDLKDILTDPGDRLAKLRIPPILYRNADGTNAPIKLHIKGCRIGMAPKFVDALRQVLGKVVPLTAPKHFHVVDNRLPGLGLFEYLDYSFTVFSKTEIKKRSDIIERLQARSFALVDGTVVPDAAWDKWVPKKRFQQSKVPFDEEVDLGRKIGRLRKLPAMAEYRHETATFERGFKNPSAADFTLAGLRQRLANLDTFKPGWGFPTYEQYSYRSFDAFIEGFAWEPPAAGADPAMWKGSRHEYTVIIPVTQPASGKLIYNFFPSPGSTEKARHELREIDRTLFYSTP
jgi:hypothetical protein